MARFGGLFVARSGLAAIPDPLPLFDIDEYRNSIVRQWGGGARRNCL